MKYAEKKIDFHMKTDGRISQVTQKLSVSAKTIDDTTEACTRYDGFICLPFSLSEVWTKLPSSALQCRQR